MLSPPRSDPGSLEGVSVKSLWGKGIAGAGGSVRSMNLTSADIARMRDTEIIPTLEQLEQEQARLDAHKIHALARLHQLRQGKKHGHGKYVGDEVAAALHWSPTTATNKVTTAVALLHRLPDTAGALERGELDMPKVHAIHEWTALLSRHHAREVAAAVHEWAPAPGHFRWTSPTGHQYEVLSEPVVEPTPDPPTLDEPAPF
jgi:hypothetical protein